MQEIQVVRSKGSILSLAVHLQAVEGFKSVYQTAEADHARLCTLRLLLRSRVRSAFPKSRQSQSFGASGVLKRLRSLAKASAPTCLEVDMPFMGIRVDT